MVHVMTPKMFPPFMPLFHEWYCTMYYILHTAHTKFFDFTLSRRRYLPLRSNHRRYRFDGSAAFKRPGVTRRYRRKSMPRRFRGRPNFDHFHFTGFVLVLVLFIVFSGLQMDKRIHQLFGGTQLLRLCDGV